MKLSDVARVFDGERLTLARHLAGLRKNGLAEKIGKTPTAVASYETGSKRPAPDTVGQLAFALGVDPEFFVAAGAGAQAAMVGAPHFRSLRSTTQASRDQARAYGLVAANVADTLERHVEFPNVDIVRKDVSLEEVDGGQLSPEDCAQEVRRQWKMSAGPAPHVVRLIENRGVVVVFSPRQVSSVDAYSFDSKSRPVVVLNPAKDDYYRQRYDAAHELGHIVMHSDAEPGSKVAETQANRFAAEFLMPRGDIEKLLPPRISWPTMLALKEEWKVSLQALVYRARSLDVLGEGAYKTAMVYISNQGWRRQEPGRTTALERPSLLAGASELLVGTGRTESDLAAECRVPLSLYTSVTSRAPEMGEVSGVERRSTGVVSLVGPKLEER